MSLKFHEQISSFAIMTALVIFAVDRLSSQSDLGQIITGAMVALTLGVYVKLVGWKADNFSKQL